SEAPWPPGRLGFAALLLVCVTAAFWNQWLLTIYKGMAPPPIQGDTDLMRYLHLRQTPVEVPLRADHPVGGNATAPHTVVVFSDFQCPACRGFAAMFERDISPALGSQLRLVYKHYPLDQDCNPGLRRTVHQNACEAAYAAEAARELGGTEA